MANLITKVEDIEGADIADLLHTYNTLTGGSVKRFSDRAVAKRRVEMAMLSAKKADEETGVPKGAQGEVKPRAEIQAKASAKGIAPPQTLEEVEQTLPPGSMAAQLLAAGKKAAPIEKRPTKKEGGVAAKTNTRKPLFAVVATFAGVSKPQAGSDRNAVLVRIQQSPKSACTIESLEQHFQKDVRGFIQKLVEKDHLVLIDTQDELDKLPKVHPKKPKDAAAA